MGAASAQQTHGIGTIFTKLGENIASVEEAEEVTQHYLDVLDKVKAAGLRRRSRSSRRNSASISTRSCASATCSAWSTARRERGNFVWIDMESSPYVDPTLDLFRRTRARSPRIGVALQAYLYRTAQDVESLLPLGAAIRMVKGAYLEPPASPIRKKPTSTRTSMRSRAA